MNQEQQVVAAVPLENAQDQHDEWDEMMGEELQEDVSTRTCQPIPVPNISFPQPNAEEEPAMGGWARWRAGRQQKPFDFQRVQQTTTWKR